MTGGGWAGKRGGNGGTYEHDVLDIVKGHSSWLIRLLRIMNMMGFSN